jgi:hypothetical protein
MTRSLPRLRACTLALTAAVALAACGGDAGGDTDGATDDTTTAPATADPAAASDPVAETHTVTAIDYAFTGLRDQYTPGSTLVLDNTSDTEVHELLAMRALDPDQDPSELFLTPLDQLGRSPSWSASPWQPPARTARG